MAVQRFGNVLRFFAATDAVTGVQNIRAIQYDTGGTASTTAGILAMLLDTAGNVVLRLPLATNSMYVLEFAGPYGWEIDGIEFNGDNDADGIPNDIIPAASELTVFLA